MQINVGPSNLTGLYVGNSKVSVPSFQRNYSWTRDQLDQFLVDVYRSAANDEAHFWGPIVLLKEPNDPTSLKVIDGQQRLTTTMIFLSLLRDAALSIPQSERFVNQGLPGQFDVFPTVRNFLFQPHQYVTPKFTGSYMIENVLNEYVLCDPIDPVNGAERPALTIGGAGMTPAQKTNSRELRIAFLHMRKSLDEHLSTFPEARKKNVIWALFRAVTDLFEIHTMELTGEDDAYVLFESLNDRGLRLNPSDLLKTYSLRGVRAAQGQLTVDAALTMWDQMVENLGDFDFTKYLRHYLLTIKSDKVQAKQIFKIFREEVEPLGANGPEKNLRELYAASDQYAMLLGLAKHPDNQLAETFERINSFTETHRIFLLGMLRTNISVVSMRLLARSIERLSFRWFAAGWNAQVLETLYQTRIHELLSDPTDANAATVAAALIGDSPTDNDLQSLSTVDSDQLQRYALRRVELATGGAIAGKPTIEHLAPQNPGQNSPHWHSAVALPDQPDAQGFIYSEYVRNWGNLTLLENKLNSSISNSTWPVKLTGNGQYQGLTASNYNVNSVIVTLPSWTAAAIQKRATWLTRTVLALTGANWAQTGTAPIQMWDGN